MKLVFSNIGAKWPNRVLKTLPEPDFESRKMENIVRRYPSEGLFIKNRCKISSKHQ